MLIRTVIESDFWAIKKPFGMIKGDFRPSKVVTGVVFS